MFLFWIRLAGDLAALGLPPDLTEKDKLRQWLLNLASVAARASEQSPTEYDDKVVAFLESLVKADTSWDRAYSLIQLLASGEDPQYVASLMQTTEVADDAEIDPITVVAIIRAIIEVIRIWRDRR